MKPGDVCLAQFPFTDGAATKLRPVLVVSKEEHNRGSDVVVLPISSRPDPDDKFSVYVDAPHFGKAGLRFPSAIKWSKPATIAKSVLRRHLGELDSGILATVTTQLMSVFR